jgi:hypothetical protein
MLRLLLFRFWPIWIPLIIYWLWWRWVGRKATIDGKSTMRFRDGPWYWAVISSLVIAVLCFVLFGETAIQGGKGNYTPPHMENGALVPGKVRP